MANYGEAEGFARLGSNLLEAEGLLVGLGAVGVPGGEGNHAAGPVEVADQQIQVHEAGDVVEAVGMLGRAAVHVDAGLLAVGGEFLGNRFDGSSICAADLGVLGDALLLGCFQHDLQA